MRLFVLSNNIDRASFRQRMGIYLDTLRAGGIETEVIQLPPGHLKRRKVFKQAVDFDGIFLHKKRLNFLDAQCLRRYARKVIYDFDDAVMYSAKKPEKPSRKRLSSFQRTVELADLVIAGNSYLVEHAKRFNNNVQILPTGLDISAYNVSANSKNDDNIRLVWIGSKSTLRYLAEIKPTLEEIGSRFANVILRIICDEFIDFKNIQVEKRMWSKETEVAYLITSDIGLAPLPDNQFTRGKCGFKILQYAAAGLPVVASTVGVNSSYVQNGVTGFHIKDVSHWLKRLDELIKNRSLRKKMGREAAVQVQKFNRDIIGTKLVSMLKDALLQQTDISQR